MSSEVSEQSLQQPSTAALVPSSSSQTKRLSTINKPNSSSPAKGLAGASGAVGGNNGAVKELVSPGELCGFVDTLLSQLETRFDEMSEQVLSRMNEMTHRIDNLENAIESLMQDDLDQSLVSPQHQLQPQQ
ncbi:uncharacterized protein I303_101151 [Kwoniella dejecticola CBS 10117]|uniref:Heat shock factor-binding protein 1 n=1 Tax=Kwoniella dejecticola CBS 10117 TaxID=1296121 RepID=A0A1A6AGZ5_9TREE|nr:uncharacterized protein I303_01157 [Kwoniella dejecticola CBS 10117]OBR89331.1 hypothetical protein I303_01157 [Kwoniella dejecticola CBS 10117]